jgi:Transmembrane family 220, helix
VISVMAIFEYYNRKLIIGLSVLYVVYLVILLPGVSEWLQQDDKSVLFDEGMKMQHLYIEESREFIGLLICLLVLALYFFRSFRRKVA